MMCQIIFVESESQALRVRVIQNFFESDSRHEFVESESSHKYCWVTLSHWFASSSQCRGKLNFTFFLWPFYAMKWRQTCCKLMPDKVENSSQNAMKWRPKMVPNVVSASLIAGYLYLSVFQFAFYLSLSLLVISTGLAQTCCNYCNLSSSVVLNVRFTTNEMCVKNKTYNLHICDPNKQKHNEHNVWSLCCHKVKLCTLAAQAFQSQQVVLLCDQDAKLVPGATWTDDPRHISNRDSPFD